ncbi:MAG: mannose-1-phosphate guanylyltransferase/mannose-6-phosphate isomerase [Pseudomonadota bacterium]
MIVPVILAGGSGTRLWPLSRSLHPKQLLRLVDSQTMLQNTLLRLKDLPSVHPPIVICNETHRFMVAEQLREIEMPAAMIILEPVGRNTAPAAAVAALTALTLLKDPMMLVLPADHHIGDLPLFRKTLLAGGALARKRYLVTFGIAPTAPETGYGYIQKGAPISDYLDGASGPEAAVIRRFVEKPDVDTARRYVACGEYRWNSGMFMFTADRYLEELQKFAPAMAAACQRAFANGRIDLDFFRLAAPDFDACPADSIDYSVMEKTDSGAMITFTAGWNDVGSWEALWQIGHKNADQNITRGDVLTHDVRHSYLNATSRLIAAVGLNHHVVVETPDAVMIAPRDRVQDVKALVEALKKNDRPETSAHRKTFRPWGWTDRLIDTPHYRVNHVRIHAGMRMSLQKHLKRAEHWVVVKGTVRVTNNGETVDLKEDESTYIHSGTVHRLENPGPAELEMIEVQTGRDIDDADIVRLDVP